MRTEDKSSLRLFYELILTPILKCVGIVGTNVTRSLKEIVWALAGVMIYNSYVIDDIKVEGIF